MGRFSLMILKDIKTGRPQNMMTGLPNGVGTLGKATEWKKEAEGHKRDEESKGIVHLPI